MEYIVYILQSMSDGKNYVGMTTDIERRLSEHNSGKTKSTKDRSPFRLLYYEKYSTGKTARGREKYFKTASGRKFLKLKIAPVAQLDRASAFGAEG